MVTKRVWHGEGEHPALFGRHSRRLRNAQFCRWLTVAATTVDPCRARPPSHVFRWGSTGSYHGQGVMQGPCDVKGYDRVSGVGSTSNRSRPDIGLSSIGGISDTSRYDAA
ncbi:hypothetical protein CA54_60980 [Symmachiella macrocystis]|uniref:Uncharacterized protein n=1 Tax=Symmachiella macrocystis TaxID=2527985 RepID=A0A5C6AYZ6_9PLAN|nr:hypothetical protein CA54_60980 [Symmachiella macrocystis]